MPNNLDCTEKDRERVSPFLVANNRVFVSGDQILKAMTDRNMSQANLIDLTGLGKGTIANFIRGKIDRKTGMRSPWCGDFANLLKIATILNVDVLTLVVKEPMSAKPSIDGVDFFSSSVALPSDPRLGLLKGQMEIEADLDMNGNAPETNREWTLKDLVGVVTQHGNYVGFRADRIDDNNVGFASICFRGQLLETGRFLTGSYEFQGGDRWQYGLVFANRLPTNPRRFSGRWIGRNSSFGDATIGGNFFANLLAEPFSKLDF
jgi:transcriptional regulator with XRE-family HTH domain